jgi:hypothetical protein
MQSSSPLLASMTPSFYGVSLLAMFCLGFNPYVNCFASPVMDFAAKRGVVLGEQHRGQPLGKYPHGKMQVVLTHGGLRGVVALR